MTSVMILTMMMMMTMMMVMLRINEGKMHLLPLEDLPWISLSLSEKQLRNWSSSSPPFSLTACYHWIFGPHRAPTLLRHFPFPKFSLFHLPILFFFSFIFSRTQKTGFRSQETGFRSQVFVTRKQVVGPWKQGKCTLSSIWKGIIFFNLIRRNKVGKV